jgi:hypothetical protein
MHFRLYRVLGNPATFCLLRLGSPKIALKSQPTTRIGFQVSEATTSSLTTELIVRAYDVAHQAVTDPSRETEALVSMPLNQQASRKLFATLPDAR